ncbi:helix-loop-helix protein delilah [Anopheles ziemanni]|uniref:helix-loop-helix protein delilah n=1 Tax=Anopheles coustani TaxID=139045 RepID=UPI00265A1169|nr:helix-loop-helix protein delilah [Anopheles coustani]XP_058171446.1 helix-loop-helix protein delilah [Anopheles ziemanni]
MRHNNIESISAITYNQRPSTEASMADANNNHNGGSPYAGHPLAADGAGTLPSEIKKDEKYSLRQRQSRRTTQDALTAAGGGRGGSTAKAATAATASAREKAAPKEKPKPKAAPLSKYRRKTANARERSRMREINSAFENLRRAVPVAVAGTSGASSPVSSPQCAGSAASSEKLTKITTLRLAMKYIRILSDMLNGGGGSLENNNDRDMVNHNEIEREVMQKGLLLMEGAGGYLSSPAVSPVRAPVEPPKPPASSSKTTSSSSTSTTNSPRKRAAKRPSSSRAKKSTTNTTSQNTTTTNSSGSRTARRTLTSSLAVDKIPETLPLTAPSLLVDPTRPDPLGMDVDLGSVLESDNDSLILSEPCLSPLTAGSVTGGLKTHGFGCPDSQSVVPNDSLEFGLFLESDADSLQLSEPCLSPLGHLDSLNPFNELLHTGFNEQTALELYL